MPVWSPGAALIVDYMLTIAISVASGVDAVFSFLPRDIHYLKLGVEITLWCCFLVLNLRGMRESIKVLLPIFLGFFFTHAIVIFLGIGMHADRIPDLIPNTLNETKHLTQQLGWVFVASLFLACLLPGRGHVYRDRSGVQQRPIARRAPCTYWQVDHVLYGGVA